MMLYAMLEGQMIEGKYHLEKLLGAGGFGAVFRASEVVRDRVVSQVAIKVIPPAADPAQQARQLEELMAARRLDHTHLVRCHAAGEFGFMNLRCLYLVMELAQGSLEDQLKAQRFSTAATRQMVQQVAQGLVYLHGQRQVHRDLKPGNVLQVQQTLKLSDFGLVRQLDTRSYAHTSNPIGTIAYMPPEAFDGKVSPAWDVWSLGVMTVAAVAGQLPYRFNEPTELLKRVMNCEVRLPSIPSELEPLVQGCLQRDWRQRWTAEQVLAFVQGGRQQQPVSRQLATPAAVQVPAAGRGQDYQERLPNGVILEMIAIPGGSFLMGSADNDSSVSSYEKPQHRVTVPAFYMGKYPITQAQYEAIMGSNPARFKGKDRPVEKVSWHDAKAFCQKLSQRTNRPYRLPSEAEWEYACRAGSQSRYCFGDNEQQLGSYAWYAGNSKNETHPVGQKQPNTFGLYDMHGNVWEWCEDVWHSNYQGAPTDGSAWVTGGNTNVHAVRGGSWGSNAGNCASGFRYIWDADCRYLSRGFRVVLIV